MDLRGRLQLATVVLLTVVAAFKELLTIGAVDPFLGLLAAAPSNEHMRCFNEILSAIGVTTRGGNPLLIDIHRSEADLQRVMSDVMGLTKINFNACVFADGLPVTLKFADAVGDILTAAPVGELPPLPFRHYI